MSNTHIDIKIDSDKTVVFIHDFSVSSCHSHTSTINPVFDYVSITSKAGEKSRAALFVCVNELDNLIESLIKARDDIKAKRNSPVADHYIQYS